MAPSLRLGIQIIHDSFHTVRSRLQGIQYILDITGGLIDVFLREIDTITTGRTDTSTNKGIVKGDINVGGIAGSMSVDEEMPPTFFPPETVQSA